jgi:hypothetical protein
MKTYRFVFQILLVAACLLSGCFKSCPDIGCATSATLTGNISVERTPLQVDVTLCAVGCVEGVVDLTDHDSACSQVEEGDTELCLKRSDDGRLDIAASWTFVTSSPRGTLPFSIKLSHYDDGQVFLDATRPGVFKTARVNDCLRCSSADVKL